jgi:uncharacterized protein involved in type VI secretion and phage assembly
MINNDILARLVERIEGRHFGKYRGHVTDNNDPDNIGRLRATVPRLLGEERTGWALPAFAYGGSAEQGLYAVPDVGAGVWIEFEGGDLSYPVWSGTWYDSRSSIPESATPVKKVFKSKSGHKVVLDDSGAILEVTHSNGNHVKLDQTSIEIKVSSGVKVVIDAPQIELIQNAPHPLVFGDQLVQYLNQIVQIYTTHMHPGEVAAPFLPVTPMLPVPPMTPPPPTLLSNQVKTG